MALVRPGVPVSVKKNEVLRAHVRVALRGAQPAMAQELLDEAEVGALAQHVRGETVSERVRGDPPIYARGARPALDDAMNAPSGQSPPARIGEERTPLLAPYREPGIHGLQGGVPRGHHALLAAFPHEPHGALA